MTLKDKAVAFHSKDSNCAQSIMKAMVEYTGFTEETAAALGAGFGNGAGCGELCGAISGAIMTIGAALGEGHRDQVKKLTRELIDSFWGEYNAVRCEDLKAAKIPCDELIRFAAAKADELLSQ